MQGIFRKENTDKALKYGIYRHLPTYEKIIRNLVSFYNKVLYGKLREDVREILSTLCKYKDVDIITNAVFVDYVHQIVVLPPKLSISNFKGYLKGKSTLMIYDKCR